MHKAAIRRNSAPEIRAMAECQYLYLGIEAEARLRKIVFDPTGLAEAERILVFAAHSQIDRWLRLVDVAFSKHYQGAAAVRVDESALTEVASKRYNRIVTLLHEDLRPIIENRNKIAHGQSEWQLKSGSDGKFKKEAARIDFGDHWNLTNLRDALEAIGEIMLALVVSRPSFERDFDRFFSSIQQAKNNLSANHDGSEFRRFARSLGPVGGWKKPPVTPSHRAN